MENSIIENNIIRHRGFTISLPKSHDTESHFSRFYSHLCECLINFCESAAPRLRSLKTEYIIDHTEGVIKVDIILSVRLREKSGEIFHKRRLLSDTWRGNELVLHEKTDIS